MLSQLRPYRRRLIVLVVLAALAGVAAGELAPARRTPAPAKTSTVTTHQDRIPPGRARH